MLIQTLIKQECINKRHIKVLNIKIMFEIKTKIINGIKNLELHLKCSLV